MNNHNGVFTNLAIPKTRLSKVEVVDGYLARAVGIECSSRAVGGVPRLVFNGLMVIEWC